MGGGEQDGEGFSKASGTSLDTEPKDGSAVVTRKLPPPELSASIHIRSLVIISFWVVVIFLGLPTWWWTTSIYRARLPLQEMLEWADGKVNSTSDIRDNRFCGDLIKHFIGLQTGLPITNSDRGAIFAGERGTTLSSEHSTCPR